MDFFTLMQIEDVDIGRGVSVSFGASIVVVGDVVMSNMIC
jgi:hypothetical protein